MGEGGVIGLDAVDWASLTHAYGSAVDVPGLLTAMVDAPDQPAFEQAMGEFLNVVNHQGSVYPATVQVVPFLWQLVDDEEDVLRKSGCLLPLVSLIQSAQVDAGAFPTRWTGTFSPLRYKLKIELHEMISQGVDRYRALLGHPALEVRALALYLLTFLAEHAETLLPAVAEFYEKEPDEWVRAAALWGYALLAERGTDWKAKTDHARFLERQAAASAHRWSKTAAALGFLRLSHGTDPIPEPLVELIADSLARPPGWPTRSRDQYYLYEELLPFDAIISGISRCCHAKMRPGLWAAVLGRLKPEPLRAHQLVRELMDVTFTRYIAANTQWLNLGTLKRHESDGELIYADAGSRRHYVPGQPLIDFQREALQAVVDCDPFWDIPTNLFSFFYHLPDDREALRVLAGS